MTLRRAVPWISPSTLLLLACVALSVPAVAGAQPQRPATTVMLKRIGEALDDYRPGGRVFVVVRYEHPNDVLGIFQDRDSAEALANVTPGTGTFGPYESVARPRPEWLFGCVHIRSAMEPGIPRYCPDLRIPARGLRGLALLVTASDGQQHTIPLPDGTDALFLGMSPIDKFVIPYYMRVLGFEQASRLRVQFDSLYRSR